MRKIQKKLVSFLCLFTVTVMTVTISSTSISYGMTYSYDSIYSNPEDIIIASPKNGYSTTSDKISILGACDYRYPLYMNGIQIITTEHGFFTEYVSLEVGENVFIFQNNGKEYKLVIKRTQKQTSSGTSTGSKVTYNEYVKDAYGVITSNYAMPRTKVELADVNLKPLTRGTVCKLLGEEGSYYKIADGTFIAKSSIKKYDKKLEDNIVSETNLTYNAARNQLVSELTMNINTLYQVTIDNQKVYLTLYNTTSAKSIKVPDNDTVKRVSKTTNTITKTVTYCYELYDNASIYGYDVLFNNGVMKFEMKVAPYLKKKGSLEGVTIFLDAGHGDNDSGALGPMGTYGPMEKDINLNIVLYTRDYLERLGAKVVLSREDDTFLSLTERVSKIRNLRPDISVSIHGNSLDSSSNYSAASGFLTYYSYKINQNVPSLINTSIANQLEFNIKDIRQKSLSLTRFTTCPGILLETKFLSNPNDYEYLIKEENQKAFGIAVGKSIEEYFEGIATYPVEVYIVKKGDSLLSIARKFNTTVQAIAINNKIKDINYIYVGQKLQILNSISTSKRDENQVK